MKYRSAFWFIPSATAGLSFLLFKLFARFPIMPLAATHEAVMIDETFVGCLRLTVPIFSVVVVTLLYGLYQFRARGPGEEGERLHHSRSWWFESLWIGTSLLLTIGLAIFGWKELRTIYGAPEADVDVQVRAEQFSWEFFYPKFNLTASRLYVPLGKRVRISLTSKDVVHSFWVPEFRMKQDAIPGKITTLLFTPTREGTYLLLCNQLCGRGHTDMTAYVNVLAPEAFEKRFAGGGAESW